MDNKLISVIVPIYNIEMYLDKCILSIINQTYKNIEIILIDDGSTDNSGKICDNYKKKDERIIVIHKTNKGLSSSRNFGLDIANGDLICFIDGDDFIEPNMLEILKNNMDKYNSDISMCSFFQIKDETKIAHNIHLYEDGVMAGKEKYDNLQNEYATLMTVAWNKLYRKEIFGVIRYPNEVIFEDDYMVCDILEMAKIISYIFKPLYNYVYRKDSISNSFSINFFNKISAINKRIQFFKNKGLLDLSIMEKRKKIHYLILYLSRMKSYDIKDKELEKNYYQELVNTNKEVKWKESSKLNKMFKVFRKVLISILAFMFKIRDFIRKKTVLSQ